MRKYSNFAKRLMEEVAVTAVIGAQQTLFPKYSDLVILDDIFPHLLSAFRIAEYNAYLESFPLSHVYSTAASFRVLGDSRSFPDVVQEYESQFPEFKERITRFHPGRALHAELAYTVFIWNAYSFLNTIERNRLPFVFTLYPGGGFALEDSTCNEKLKRVCSSPNLCCVIATQKITVEYLLANDLCDPSKVKFIYGGVFPWEPFMHNRALKKYFRRDKSSFDICFVANKYTARGIDKGYDVFIETVSSFSKSHANVAVHIVGNFDKNDIDTSDIEKINFYGYQKTSFFREFYANMDVILSPNAPFLLGPGAFDGFPTGACAEAGMSGVAVFCTDLLNQNIYFKDGEDIVIVPRSADEILNRLDHYYYNRDDLIELSKLGQAKFTLVFSPAMQLHPRLQILTQFVN